MSFGWLYLPSFRLSELSIRVTYARFDSSRLRVRFAVIYPRPNSPHFLVPEKNKTLIANLFLFSFLPLQRGSRFSRPTYFITHEIFRVAIRREKEARPTVNECIFSQYTSLLARNWEKRFFCSSRKTKIVQQDSAR